MKNASIKNIELIICGSSDGGLQIYKELLAALPANFPLPVVIVQHLHKDTHNNLITVFPSTQNKIKFADDTRPYKLGISILPRLIIICFLKIKRPWHFPSMSRLISAGLLSILV